jgi:hypothetical protein
MVAFDLEKSLRKLREILCYYVNELLRLFHISLPYEFMH